MNPRWAFAVLLLPSADGFAADANLSQVAGGPYGVSRESIAAGGGAAAGSVFSLVGTIGQPSAFSAAGGTFELFGGFHGSALSLAPLPDALFSDGFEDAP